MRNNKGYTLIELIATIALLAIIAVISFVSVNGVIKKNKIENCHTVVNSITTATNEYVSDYRYNSLFVNSVGDDYQTIISGSTLLEEHYLNSDIIDPYTKEVIDPTSISVSVYLGYDYAMRAAVINTPDVLKECDTTLLDGIPDLPPQPTDPNPDTDKTPPIVLYDLNSGTYKSTQTLHIEARDTGSGVDYMAVRVYKDGEKIDAKSSDKIMASNFTVELDDYGVWKVLAYAYDNAGNRSNQSPKDSDGWYYQEYTIVHKPIYIYYHQNGGVISGKCSLGGASLGTCTAKDNLASVSNKYAYSKCEYGNDCDLWNYNSSTYLMVTKEGHSAVSKKEWCTTENGSGSCYDHNHKYTYDQIVVDATEQADNYKLTVYVNWQHATYTINYYQGNGASTDGATKIGTSECKYMEPCTLRTYANLGGIFPYSEADNAANSSHTNYVWSFAYWSINQDKPDRDYTDGESFNYNYARNIDIYAVGKKEFEFYSGSDSVKIATKTQYWNPYSRNSSYFTSIQIPASSGSINSTWSFCGYKAGNSEAKETNCTNPTYTASQVGTYIKPAYNAWRCTRSVYSRELKVSYNKNNTNATGTTGDTTLTQYFNTGWAPRDANLSPNSITLASNGYSLAGYSFSKWAEGSASGTQYNAGSTYTGIGTSVTDATITKTMYAKWIGRSYTIHFMQGKAESTAGYNELGTQTSCTYGTACTLNTYNWAFPYSEADNNANSSHTNYKWSFAGWTTSTTGGTNIDYADGASYNLASYSADVYLYAVGKKVFEFYGGSDSHLIGNKQTQYWNPYSTSTDYMTSITIPNLGNSEKISSWSFCGYKGGSSSATEAVCNSPTYATSDLGQTRKPGYKTWPCTRGVYYRTLTVGYNKNNTNATGTTGDTTLTQYFNTGWAPRDANLSSNSITLASNGYSLAGYNFTKWAEGSSSGTQYDAGIAYTGIGTSVTNETISKTMYAKWEYSTNTVYKVKHYVHDLGSNTYTLNSTDSLTGTTGATLTLTNLKKTIAGFTYVNGYATDGGTTRPATSSAVTTTTILADGSRVISLYYRRNYLYVQYHVNGGSLASEHGDGYSVVDSLVTRSSGNTFLRGVYGGIVGGFEDTSAYIMNTSGLDNYNNSNYMNLVKTGYIARSGSEWCTSASGGTCYNQASSAYDANGFAGADLSTGDKTVILYVNWVGRSYTIHFMQGKAESTAGYNELGTQTSCTYGTACTLSNYSWTFPYSAADNSANSSHNDYGWSFAGWTTSDSGGTNINYNNGASYNPSEYSANVYLYAVGKKTFHFYGFRNGSTVLLSEPVQKWNPYSTSTSYMTAIAIPAKTDITTWTFCGYVGGTSAASASNCSSPTYAATTAGTNQTPAYNKWPYTRSIYSRVLTVSYAANNSNATGSTSSTTLTQYFNTGYSNDNAKISSNSITLASNGYTLTGYSFSKWAEGSASGTQYGAEAAYTGIGTSVTDETISKTMYAKWTAKKLNITFNCNGGTLKSGATNKVTYTYGVSGQKFPNPAVCEKTGYAGSKWTWESSGTLTGNYTWTSGVSDNWINDNSTGDTSKTLYAQWTPKKLNITFDCNGGTLKSGATNTVTYTYGVSGQKFPNPAVCERTNYTGSKWTWEKSGTLTGNYTWTSGVKDSWINDNSTGNTNKTLYAQWDRSTVTISWDKNFFSNNLLGNDPIRGNVGYTSGQSVCGGTGGASTQWHSGAYNTTSYYINIGAWFPNTSNSQAGFYIKNMPTLTKDSKYTVSYFIRTQGNASDTYDISGPAQGGNKSITITNNWQRIQYTFTATTASDSNKILKFYHTSNKSINECYYLGIQIHSLELMAGTPNLSPTEQTPGDNLTLPTEPTRSGFSFAGWFTAPVGGTEVDTATKVPNTATTYYAQWAYKVDTSASCVKRLSVGGEEVMCYGTRQQVTSEGRCQWGCMNATCYYVNKTGSFFYGNIEGGSC